MPENGIKWHLIRRLKVKRRMTVGNHKTTNTQSLIKDPQSDLTTVKHTEHDVTTFQQSKAHDPDKAKQQRNLSKLILQTPKINHVKISSTRGPA